MTGQNYYTIIKITLVYYFFDYLIYLYLFSLLVILLIAARYNETFNTNHLIINVNCIIVIELCIETAVMKT